jgi:protein-tyrosine phosphatase
MVVWISCRHYPCLWADNPAQLQKADSAVTLDGCQPMPHNPLHSAHLHPRSRQVTRVKVQALVDAGIRTFVNLMEEDETNYAGETFVPYQDLARQLCPGARCCRLAIRDLSAPTPELMTTIQDAIDESMTAGKPVYVH